ncbi:diacylglycerol kinase family protein [Neobacillus notoginsengisoli]|uniref:Diacylglycerol kinase family protein n=2 Tax=Neobacillus notoginsengisoli TaxID=1578198 RepID=A0A417YUP9_9BACI|nr:diacylglycerol kinase family protein [Neobacillus notoginsengisoli]RHW41023.1 diacylglycerol kinase family protein [Neobacillus notoginsengisoli]
MHTGFQGFKDNACMRLIKSFGYAIAGIAVAVKTERNLKIHLVFATIAIGFSFFFSISKTEWLFILFLIGGMISLELLNTAIERAVNLVTEEVHPLAKQAKDIAAGAVFIFACLSVVTGLIIFLPRLAKWVGL